MGTVNFQIYVSLLVTNISFYTTLIITSIIGIGFNNVLQVIVIILVIIFRIKMFNLSKSYNANFRTK